MRTMHAYLFLIPLVIAGMFGFFENVHTDDTPDEVDPTLGCYCEVDGEAALLAEVDTQGECEVSRPGVFNCHWTTEPTPDVPLIDTDTESGDESSGSPASIQRAQSLNKLGISGGVSGIRSLLGSVIGAGMSVMGTIALVVFIYGGIEIMFAGGNPERFKRGLMLILWASLGLFVILTSYVIVEFVFDAFRS